MDNKLVTILAIIALVISIMASGYLYINHPKKTDLSNLVTQKDFDILKAKVNEIDYYLSFKATINDFNIQSKSIKNLRNDLDDLEDDFKDLKYNIWYDMTLREYNCLKESINHTDGNYTGFKRCID